MIIEATLIQILRWHSAAPDQLGQLTPGKLRQLCGLVRAGGAAGRSWCGQQQPGPVSQQAAAAPRTPAQHCTALLHPGHRVISGVCSEQL